MQEAGALQSNSNPGLTKMSAAELAHYIRLGEFSSVEVVEAFIEQIERVNPRLNAVVAPTFEQARLDAAKADSDRREGKPLGPLHGVPITVKECFDVKNTPTTLGLPSRHNHKAFADDVLVARLRSAGGIVLGKTNTPQLLSYLEADNPLYGKTSNPWSLKRSPGGSSGGEAAIIAAGGSPLGLATDLGGNIRIPAHMCGIHGFTPTPGRLPFPGRFASRIFPGQEGIQISAGPLAKSVTDLRLAMDILTQPGLERIEPLLAPVNYGNPAEVHLAGMRVAMYYDDGFFEASPAVRRAVREAARALQEQGVEVVHFKPPAIELAIRLYYSILSATGGAGVKRLLAKNRRDKRLKKVLSALDLPSYMRPFAVQTASRLWQKKSAAMLRYAKPLSAAEYCILIDERNAYRQKFLSLLDDQNFDAIICPPFALPAITHGAGLQLLPAASYSILFNLLGMPSGTVAATKVLPGEESDRLPSRDLAERAARNTEKSSAGLPVGVQVAGWPWRDHVVLAIMQVLENYFKNDPDYPILNGEF